MNLQSKLDKNNKRYGGGLASILFHNHNEPITETYYNYSVVRLVTTLLAKYHISICPRFKSHGLLAYN